MASLTFDPYSENTANQPFELMSPAEDQIIAVTSMAFPAPPPEVQWASSVDTEGSLVASRKHQNRQITLGVEIVDPGLPAATNLVPNPAPGSTVSPWNDVVAFTNTTTRSIVADSTSPSSAGTALQSVGTGAASDQGVEIALGTLSAGTHSVGLWLKSISGATTIRIALGKTTPANDELNVNAAFVMSTTAYTRVTGTVTVVNAGPYHLFIRNPAASAATWRVAQAIVVTGSTVPVYFDGDTPGASWAGTRHASSSSRLAGAARGAAALRHLQAKVAKIAREEGTLQWVLPNSEIVTFDLLSADQFEPVFDEKWDVHTGGVCSVNMTFTARPYGRGPEVALGDHVETTLPALVFTDTGIKGDMPGLARLVVDNDTAGGQDLIYWGLQSKEYSSANSAKLYYESEATPLGTGATAAGPAGASGGGSNTILDGSLSNSVWRAIHYVGDVGSTPPATHIGQFRVIARVWAPTANAGVVSVRINWYVGAGPPTIGDYVTMPTEGAWHLLDLGQVSIPRAPRGTQSWTCAIEAISTSTNDDIYSDFVILLPITEGSGQSSKPTGTLIAGNKSIQIGSTGVFIKSGTDDWSRPAIYEGDYLTIPPAALMSGTLRFIVKMKAAGSASPVTQDDAIDDLSAILNYTPRYLVVPNA